jgi:sugar lactone lactonase YvrE
MAFAHLLQGLIGLAFVALGLAKLAGIRGIRDAFVRFRLPDKLRYVIGPVEVLGGAAMLASIFQPFLAFFAAVVLALILLGALGVHFIRGPRAGWQVAGALLLATLSIIGLQPLGLRVLALPAADTLPQLTAPASEILATYDPGVFLESVAVSPDGTLYISANKGLNLQTGDTSKVSAHILRRAPDGAESIMFAFPANTVAGVIALAPDGALYMTATGTAPGIWRITLDGSGDLLAALPKGAWPNGLTFGPDGKLYAADSALGRIWKIDPADAAVTIAIEDDALRARAWIALAPGANGLHFFGDDLFVTVSDRATVLRFRATAKGGIPKSEVVASGVPGDDFAIDSEGTLYVTTHPYNTLVRITSDGQRTVVADHLQGMTGATDAAFATDDPRRLFIVTDGGAFGGDPAARGTLVSLRLAPN